MGTLRRWFRSPFALLRRRRLEADLAEEMRLHLEHLAAVKEAEGMTPAEAHYVARRQFGASDQFKEELRDGLAWNWADQLVRDFRHALRSLGRERAFAGAFLATFALCLSANIVIFSLVHAVLLAPLPYASPEQLVTVGNSYPKYGQQAFVASIPNYYEWKGDIPAFAAVATFQMSTAVTGPTGAPERVQSGWAAPAFFRILGVHAQLGRLPAEEDGEYGGSTSLNIVVISDGFWRQQFSADPDVVGKSVSVDGQPNTVIGVLPRDFHFYAGNAAIWGVQRWPASMKAGSRHWNGANVIARLRPGVTIEQAQAQVDALNAHLAKADPRADWAKAGGFRSVVRSIHAAQVAEVRPALLPLQGGALLLLFVGVVNLVNLLAVRASARRPEMALRLAAVGVYGVMAYAVVQRQREIGVRMAIGADPARILAQFLRVGGFLALAGIVLGAAASLVVNTAIRGLLFNVSPSSPAVYLAAAGTLGAAILAASFLPSRRAAAVSVMESLRCE